MAGMFALEVMNLSICVNGIIFDFEIMALQLATIYANNMSSELESTRKRSGLKPETYWLAGPRDSELDPRDGAIPFHHD